MQSLSTTHLHALDVLLPQDGVKCRRSVCFSHTPVGGNADCFACTWIYRWESSQYWRREALKKRGKFNWCMLKCMLKHQQPAWHSGTFMCSDCVPVLLCSSFTQVFYKSFYIAIYVALYTRAYFMFTWVLTTSRGDLPLLPVRFRCPRFRDQWCVQFCAFSAPNLSQGGLACALLGHQGCNIYIYVYGSESCFLVVPAFIPLELLFLFHS